MIGIAPPSAPGQAPKSPLSHTIGAELDDMTEQEHWIDGPGGRLFARSWAPRRASAETATSILLLHDSLGCVDLWRDFPGRLADATGLQVAAYDRLGFGRSDPRSGTLGRDFVSEEVKAIQVVIDQLGMGTVVPFGHSVGGGMAICAAARLPERCSAVVTVAAQAFVEDLTLAGIREAQRAFQEPGQTERLARYHGQKAPWVLSAWIDTWLSPEFADYDLGGDLARVRSPVLALHGDRDEYGSGLHPERIARGCRGPSQAVILKDCGHVAHRECAAAVLDAVTEFLRTAHGHEPASQLMA